MSDRPAESALSRASTADAGKLEAFASASLLPPPPPAASALTSPSDAKQAPPTGRAIELPPLPAAYSFTGGNFPSASARSTSFSAILNPTRPDDVSQNRRRKASHLESPPSSIASLPPLNAEAPSAVQREDGRRNSSNPREPHGRRMLTPRSPALPRTTSVHHLNPPTGTINAQQSPFPTSPHTRAYTAEPGASGVPSLPTPPAGSRLGYGFPTGMNHIDHTGRTSGEIGRPSRLASSPSLSPKTPYTSYDQSAQRTPPIRHVQNALPTLSSAYPNSHETSPHDGSSISMTPGFQERQRPLGIPISSATGTNMIQMMTIETEAGTVSLPVDVQAASRVADEKRRRNAGASARFRARRKEKEREASMTIAKLELQLKDMTEDADFYRRERGYLAGVVLQVPGGERHFPRPQSPRHRRTSSVIPGTRASTSGSSYMSDMAHSPPLEGRRVRRRTSTLSLPPLPPSTHVGSHGLQPSYVSTPYNPPPLAHNPPYQHSQQPMPSPMSRPPIPLSGHLPPLLQHGHPPHTAASTPVHVQAHHQRPTWGPYANDNRPHTQHELHRDSHPS